MTPKASCAAVGVYKGKVDEKKPTTYYDTTRNDGGVTDNDGQAYTETYGNWKFQSYTQGNQYNAITGIHLVYGPGGGGTGTTALNITGGNSSATNPAVSITGHLTASTKSFNIPHPIHDDKRLIYGVLEGPEFGA